MIKPAVDAIFQSYLGDGVYVDYDGYNIVLKTDNLLDHPEHNTIYLEPSVVEHLINYQVSLKNRVYQFNENRRKNDE